MRPYHHIYAAMILGLSLPALVLAVVQGPLDDRLMAIATAMTTADGQIDNRVGFAFASLDVGSEDGEDSSIEGSSSRVKHIASVLSQHPDMNVVVEGHVGVSAPPEISQDFSEHRAHIVAQLLESHGITPHRVETRGWGSRVAVAAQASDHPNARAAKAGFGWAEMFIVVAKPGFHSAAVVPDRPDYYPDEPNASPPPAPRADPASHPIFYMRPGAAVGDAVALHLFEPRYKLLIQRAWASDKRFVYCTRPPMSSAMWDSFNLPVDQEPEDGDGCVVVLVEKAIFTEDGQADIMGVAVNKVTLQDVQLEPGTGGLFSTRTPLPLPLAMPQPSPQPSPQPLAQIEEAPRADEENEDEEEAGESTGSHPHHHVCRLMAIAVLAGACAGAASLSSYMRPRPAKLRFCPAPASPATGKKLAAVVPPLPGNIVLRV